MLLSGSLRRGDLRDRQVLVHQARRADEAGDDGEERRRDAGIGRARVASGTRNTTHGSNGFLERAMHDLTRWRPELDHFAPNSVDTAPTWPPH